MSRANVENVRLFWWISKSGPSVFSPQKEKKATQEKMKEKKNQKEEVLRERERERISVIKVSDPSLFSDNLLTVKGSNIILLLINHWGRFPYLRNLGDKFSRGVGRG